MLSSKDSDFNTDFCVEASAEEKAAKKPLAGYNYGNPWPFAFSQYPGVSIFVKSDDKVFHTYSAFSRGLDILNGAHSMFDFLPSGRDGFMPKHKNKY